MSKVIFLCGSMGEENYIDKFYEAETTLTALGYTVLNPIMLPEALDLPIRIQITSSMIQVCDMVVIFDDWVYSVCGRSEIMAALNFDKDIIGYKDIIKRKGI